jgi:hypothetical protein
MIKFWRDLATLAMTKHMEIFYAATTITLRNGRKTSFWHAPCLEGRMLKDIAPKIFDLCKRKKWTVAQALQDNEWISKLSTDATLSIEHLTRLVQLWALIQMLTLTTRWRMTFRGSSRAMADTPRPPCTICNSLALLNQVSRRLFGRLGHHQK